MNSGELVFFGSPICPYCQRVELALRDAELRFHYAEVKLGCPSPKERALSPFGRFPLLTVEETALFESGAILEWINEQRHGRYLPTAINERARVRGLCAAIDAQHVALRSFFTARSEPQLKRAHTEALRHLQALENVEGPWFHSSGDAMQPFLSGLYLAPLILLCDMLDTPEWPLLSAVPRLAEAHDRLVLGCQSLQLLETRRPEVASFFLGVDSLLTRHLAERLGNLASSSKSQHALAQEARRYMGSKERAG